MYSELHFKNHFKKHNKIYRQKKISSKEFTKVYKQILLEIENYQKTLNILSKNFKINIKDLKKFKRFKTIAIIGMGGSILGCEAINSFLKKKIKKKIYFFNNIDENKIINYKKKENPLKTVFIIISKSGNTIETLSNIFSLNIIKNKAKNVIIISEKKNNLLFHLAKKYKLFYIEHNSYIGGRYSVLSEVGLVPAYLMGVSISKLRSNIKSIFKLSNKKFLKESSIQLAGLLGEKKYNNLVFLNYSPELEKFLYWCQQLIAESLGKNNKGFLPIISNAPKDHHSLLQLYLDGPKDKIFYVFSANAKSKIQVNFKRTLNKENFLNKKTLSFIKNAQKNAMIKSLSKNKIPFREFKIKKFNEETLSKLFSYFILETVTVGMLSKINPYDQPAVEEVKVFTKELIK